MGLASVALATVRVHKGWKEVQLGMKMTAEEERLMVETSVLMTVFLVLVHTCLAVERWSAEHCKVMDLVGLVVASCSVRIEVSIGT